MSIFSMISNFKKLNFCNFFRPFLPPATPQLFPSFRAFFAHDIPHQNPRHFPHLSSLSGGILRSHTSQSMTHSFPRISPLSGEAYGAIFTQNIAFLLKFHTFWCKFQLARRETGEIFGEGSGRNLGTFPPKHPSEREKIGECLGAVWGRNGVKTGRFKH